MPLDTQSSEMNERTRWWFDYLLKQKEIIYSNERARIPYYIGTVTLFGIAISTYQVNLLIAILSIVLGVYACWISYRVASQDSQAIQIADSLLIGISNGNLSGPHKNKKMYSEMMDNIRPKLRKPIPDEIKAIRQSLKKSGDST